MKTIKTNNKKTEKKKNKQKKTHQTVDREPWLAFMFAPRVDPDEAYHGLLQRVPIWPADCEAQLEERQRCPVMFGFEDTDRVGEDIWIRVARLAKHAYHGAGELLAPERDEHRAPFHAQEGIDETLHELLVLLPSETSTMSWFIGAAGEVGHPLEVRLGHYERDTEFLLHFSARNVPRVIMIQDCSAAQAVR